MAPSRDKNFVDDLLMLLDGGIKFQIFQSFKIKRKKIILIKRTSTVQGSTTIFEFMSSKMFYRMNNKLFYNKNVSENGLAESEAFELPKQDASPK